ncbi:aminotransferase class IV [Beutenbergia cavernae DSM 12333]|uniref:Aminotransferase class IV n=1 Tax=Beutenbergia cavernae (strain ATCC BAA-8 / DSM 12333 / CCUG 43141 / JCM 11478 / NBRC 16432 / NCIMB 13614 / HKI 0122) TaxID=471853 RepID=C5C5P1_BEUC1|nr:aminotransferase class IV [Beutenbergia cavernae]ACQ80232.1 aminotransferase class IV [Beutenbergia cavernae DSM 12333]
MTTIAWFDGALRDPAEPLVSLLDHGITVGDGVFETCELVGGRAFALTRHVARLGRSASGLGLAAPDESVLRGAVADVERAWVAAHGDAVGRLRITWTAGVGPLGSDRLDSPGTLIVAASPARPAAPARVAVVPWPRNERGALAGLKTTSYAENVVALAHAAERGASEAIFANTRGELCEGTGTNVFCEDDRGLVTPPLSSGALAGVTRALVLEWAADAGIPAREETLPLDALRTSRHAALTSSTRGIVPIIGVDDVALEPGPLTLAMGEEFARRQAEQIDP